ncbi:MAG: hypothetical protein H6721_03035 [Sandaracinus sp.]|nr:hypothetical protein [Sandaracinus sp.]MCB9614632.1 hypothetical protein [Sandaracinus sp.]MCB9631109.1 hypothetical protein [Sandaracinus sp.]
MKKLATLLFACLALTGCADDLASECNRDDECSGDKICAVSGAVCSDPEDCLGQCFPSCVTEEDCPGAAEDYDCVGEFGTGRTYCRPVPASE